MNTNTIVMMPLLSYMLIYEISVEASVNKLKKNMKEALDWLVRIINNKNK